MFAVVDLSLASKKFWHEEDVRAEMYFFGPFLEDEISLWRIRTFSMEIPWKMRTPISMEISPSIFFMED